MPKREKWRYAVVKVEGGVNLGAIEAIVQGLVQRVYGIRGLAETSPSIVHLDETRRIAVVKVRRDFLQTFRAALELAPRNTPALLRIIRVTGTLKAAKRYVASLPKEPV